MKQLSAGVIILNNGRILLGHSTHNTHWDIFKGSQEPGETPLQTALRELREESGIVLQESDLIDLGKFKYTKKKNLYLFLFKDKNDEIKAEDCFCASNVDDKFPEMDDFKYVSVHNLKTYCVESMVRVLEPIPQIYKGASKHERQPAPKQVPAQV